jgi:hypothetical protein
MSLERPESEAYIGIKFYLVWAPQASKQYLYAQYPEPLELDGKQIHGCYAVDCGFFDWRASSRP